MSESIEEIARAVERAARGGLDRVGALRNVVPVDSSRRFYSSGARLRLVFDHAALDVYVKVYRRQGRGFESECVGWAREESSLLHGVHALSGSEGEPSVVRPLWLLAEIPAVVFEFHHGEPLSNRLRPRRPRFGMAPDCLRTTQALFSEAGRHLRAFHEMTGPEGSGRPLVERLEPIEQPLDAVIESTDQMAARMARLCRPRLAPALLDLHVHAKRAFQERVTDRYPRNGVHGDFTPVNVFVDSGKTTLFDFVNFHLGHPYEDLGRFLAYTLFLRKNPLLFRSVDVSALCSAFLDGYGLTDRVSDPELVFFFQRSLFRTIGGGLRFQERSWPLNMVYARAMRRVLDSWISAGGGLP